MRDIIEIDGPPVAGFLYAGIMYRYRTIVVADDGAEWEPLVRQLREIMVGIRASLDKMAGDKPHMIVWRQWPAFDYADDRTRMRMRVTTVPEIPADEWRVILGPSCDIGVADGN